ncbi:hypothetical protein ACO0LC_10015 [Undibacterium sp. JH2W]|uniref:hypothetical protein n=1 Tax=Undibacterium sp. JH2W TaxID=3413037 RepID=UPI003BF1ED89
MLHETPATPQTAALLFPFSVPHKRRLHMGMAKVKNNYHPKVNPKVNPKPNSNSNSNSRLCLFQYPFSITD